MSFKDFVHKYKLKNKATSNIKTQQILSSLSMNDVGIHLRDVSLRTDVGKVNLHTSKGTQWVACININYFDSYGCAPPQKVSEFITKRNEHFLFSGYKKQ